MDITIHAVDINISHAQICEIVIEAYTWSSLFSKFDPNYLAIFFKNYSVMTCLEAFPVGSFFLLQPVCLFLSLVLLPSLTVCL